MDIDWLDVIKTIGTKTLFVATNEQLGDGITFSCNDEYNELSISETLNNVTTVVLSISYDDDDELEFVKSYSTSYDNPSYIEDEMYDWYQLMLDNKFIKE